MLPHQLFGGCRVSPPDGVDNGQMLIDCLSGWPDQALRRHPLIGKTDAVVSFVMDPDFSSDSLLGVGEVKWCVPKKGSNKFESGIAFLNYSTSESMREYLEI